MTHQNEAPDLLPLLAVDALMYCTPKGGAFHRALQDSKCPQWIYISTPMDLKSTPKLISGMWNTVDTFDYQLTHLR